MKTRWVAHAGLIAVAVVFTASMGILIFHGTANRRLSRQVNQQPQQIVAPHNAPRSAAVPERSPAGARAEAAALDM
jgi:hypothetical protein